MAIDGPAGPPKKAKLGAIIMSAQTGLPIIPITFQTTHERYAKGWDRKRVPRIFSSWTIVYEKPVYADPLNFKKSRLELEKALG